MDSHNTLQVLKNILKTKVYLYTIVIVFLLLTIVPIIVQKVFIPSFKAQIISNILDESKRVAGHLSNSIDYINLSTKEVDSIIKGELKEFQIDKIHYFHKDGTVIYSTIKDKIGTLNTHSYFHNIVAKGELYYKIQRKGGKSSEYESINTDIIEIYIPIMKNGEFSSAFEVYYNISKEIVEFEKLSKDIITINIVSSIIAALLLFIIIYKASKNNIQLREYQNRLKVMAHNDSLTNLYNRRYFYKITTQILNLSSRNDEPVSVCMIDIDNFKKINDTYGHQVGDKVIKSLSQELVKITRKSDLVARYGGEEFIILFPNTDIEGAKIITNKICKDVEGLELRHEDIDIKFTISIGVSQFKNDQPIDEFINNADTALYTAKNSGKNRVVVG